MGHKETPIQKEILDYLNRQPGACFTRTQVLKINLRKRWIHSGTPGWGDITGCYIGIPIMFEVKVPGGRTNKETKENQKNIRAKWRKSGGKAYVVKNVHDVVGIFQTLKQGAKEARKVEFKIEEKKPLGNGTERLGE